MQTVSIVEATRDAKLRAFAFDTTHYIVRHPNAADPVRSYTVQATPPASAFTFYQAPPKPLEADETIPSPLGIVAAFLKIHGPGFKAGAEILRYIGEGKNRTGRVKFTKAEGLEALQILLDHNAALERDGIRRRVQAASR
jgi:hypothetical protein